MMESDGTLGRVPSNGGRGLRRQRSLEWRERRGYGASVHSSSDDEDNNRHAVPTSVSSRGGRSPGHVFASLLAQQYSGTNDRTYHRTVSDTEGGVTSDNPTTPFPASVAGAVPAALTPNHRQASPFPMESTNSRRHHYNNSVSSDRSRNVANGEVIYAAPSKKTSSGNSGNPSTGGGSVSGGTLGRRSRRGQHNSALSSSSTASDRSETIYNDEHSHMHLNNDNGRDSPPEPAPPEVPPRGPSLLATHTIRAVQQNRNGCPGNAAGFNLPSDDAQSEAYSEYLMSGSPRSYPVRSPGVASTPTVTRMPPSQQQVTVGSLGGMVGPGNGTGTTGAQGQPLVMPSFPLRAAVGPHYSPYSPSRFHIDKRCQHRCSWKCFSVALILLTVALTAILAYFAAVSSMRPIDNANCILDQDLKTVTHENTNIHDPISTQLPTEESLPTSTAEHSSASDSSSGEQQSDPQIQQSAQQWPAVLELKAYDVAHFATILPYNFWHSEFRNKQPAFIRLNLTLPWSANFAVYGRRNVAPSVTQYDFVKFVRGGRVDQRSKRQVIPGAVSFMEESIIHEEVRSVDDRVSPDNRDNEDDIDNYQHILMKRQTHEPLYVNVSLLQYLDTGRWFLSVYNDELRPYKVTLVVTEAEGVSTTCPNDCSGRGSCYLGKCDCIDGYQGADCSKSVCPVLCSSHGQYGGGICHCEEGWKGLECDIPLGDCQVPDCNSHGQCVRGSCVCNPGWKGEFCGDPDCRDPTCSSHGACVAGKCYCKAGWQGEKCDQVDQRIYQCLPGCSDHGSYDLETGACICEEHWTGGDCSQSSCSLDCGSHGSCEQGLCKCHDGWTGTKCDQKPCDPRCAEHGQCKNGTCVCSQGWNGRHCTLPGCENGCSRHGICTLQNGEYSCECSGGWAGRDCSIELETECKDEIDNNNDGMMDCFDSECCSQPACSKHLMCLVSSDPVEVLLRKQPPSVTASFWLRVKFLIEEKSVQSYVHVDEYDESLYDICHSRVAVMRGQVVTEQGLGIVGIRVSVDRTSRFGFTLTRAGGWFDILVNGGGAVTLQFQRNPFDPLTRTVFVPWNQIVVLPPVVMTLPQERKSHKSNLPPIPAVGFPGFPGLSMGLFVSNGTFREPCMEHNHETLRPIIVGTWMPEKVGGLPGRSLVLAETQIVQESIPIPGSNVHLMYQSSQAAGYLSTVRMQLTGPVIPVSLTHVHVHVEIEGSVHTKTYEADPNLTHTFAWNKRNVYKQKVYGVAQARVSVGYQHSSCPSIIWETQTATLQGFDVDISDVGGWGLDIHHHYNFHEGILQKGDGSTLHFKQYPRTVKVVMGTGLQRSLVCQNCDGLAKDARLLTPVALASGPDGSIYVGDFNLVRRITPKGNVYTVLILSATQVAYQYYLSVSPADGHLYISDPEKHRILKALSLDEVPDPSINIEPVVGSGERCIPGDEGHCGDGGPAILAKLAHPKGIAIAADKTMYIADGTNIRAVDPDGIIHTLVGHHGHHNHWSPAPCVGAIPAHQAQLQWPTGLTLSPLDGTLHFIDDRLVLKLTSDLKVRVVAGTPLHCTSSANTQPDMKINSTIGGNGSGISYKKSDQVLGSVLAVSFSPTGDLYIADSDSHRVNSIRVVDSSGKMSHYAGRLQERLRDQCECSNSTKNIIICPCNEDTSSTETLLSSNAKFTAISALAVTPDGVLHVADQGSLHILALQPYLPSLEESGEFQIPYPPSNEIYVFNRYGQHTVTKDLTTGTTRYAFLYSKNTSFGKLSTVTDSAGNKITFLRDYSGVVSSIENTQDHKSELKISGIGFLVKLSETGRSEISLDYDSETGLLTSRCGGGETYIYNYDTLGRVSNIILPTGENIKLISGLSDNEALSVKVEAPLQALAKTNKNRVIEFKIQKERSNILTITDAAKVYRATSFPNNNSLQVILPSGGRILTAATTKHPLLEAALPVEAEMLPMWSYQVLTLGELINTMTTTYNLVGDVSHPQQTLNREIWVNDSRVIGVKFEQLLRRETFYVQPSNPLLNVTFDLAGLPLSWQPQYGHSLNITYDRFNRIQTWQWGASNESYNYDRRGQLSEVTNSQDGTKRYTYNDFNALSKITLASKREFSLEYDENGGLRHIILPAGTRHSFSCQASLGFLRVTYTPPGSTRSYLQHYSHEGNLLQTVFPGDGARIVYRYHPWGQLSEIVHGDGKSEIRYTESGLPSEVIHTEKDVEYRWDYQYSAGLLIEERIDFEAKTGLSNAKFTFDYDANYRLIAVQGRIGGQTLPAHTMAYSSKTGALEQIGQFKVNRPAANETIVYDGTAVFSRVTDKYFLETQVKVTIHGLVVFRMEFTHDSKGRINQTRTDTSNVGVNTYTNVKNYTWDSDGQLTGIDAQEPWGFRYDGNGNMLSLTYRGNTIPMEYNNLDRIVKFGDGLYKYDNRGQVIQNAREERFNYNAKGLLIRATKKGRFDVRYYYDHLDRLATRKDNYGNVTQFFYNNQKRPHEVSQIYSPRDGKVMSLIYDDRGHLIYAQIYRHKYYIATDQCGTPIMIFNQYGEGIRELMRSPYGHIVYDSNPYLYLPVDYCGGLLDKVTSLVHMPNGKVYDPLIGQYMSPLWENVLDRIATPTHLHLYRFNGNDPIDVRHARERNQPTDHISWLNLLGYDLKSLAPQLFPEQLPDDQVPPSLNPQALIFGGKKKTRNLGVQSGFLAHISQRHSGDAASLLAPPRSALKKDPSELIPSRLGAASDPPFGQGILVSRTADGKAVVSSVPAANQIYRDVFTTVFNRSYFLPFSFVVHSAQQDAFYFVKEETWKSNDDRGQLKRLGGQVNTTFHESENGSGSTVDVKIHGASYVVNLRYGTTAEKEKQRLLHHAKITAIRKAWHRERDALKANTPTSIEWMVAEQDEIVKDGSASNYDGEYIHDAQLYPELAEDPYNIRFVKKINDSSSKKRRRRRGTLTVCKHWRLDGLC
ncbi:teneurin-a isoform X2 [Microplitis mediator]|uniref:teneurin-a isoform X2 n=1 Tax=Microplitis mediator TaxID=375433 RepID=UPI00255392D4|nr:teneurin-a isoform X2 [Microplitis mediator]